MSFIPINPSDMPDFRFTDCKCTLPFTIQEQTFLPRDLLEKYNGRKRDLPNPLPGKCKSHHMEELRPLLVEVRQSIDSELLTLNKLQIQAKMKRVPDSSTVDEASLIRAARMAELIVERREKLSSAGWKAFESRWGSSENEAATFMNAYDSISETDKLIKSWYPDR